jgi:hypothetical protein
MQRKHLGFTGPVALTAKNLQPNWTPTGSNLTSSCSCYVFSVCNCKQLLFYNRLQPVATGRLVSNNLADYLIKTSLRTLKTVEIWASYGQNNYFTSPYSCQHRYVHPCPHFNTLIFAFSFTFAQE